MFVDAGEVDRAGKRDRELLGGVGPLHRKVERYILECVLDLEHANTRGAERAKKHRDACLRASQYIRAQGFVPGEVEVARVPGDEARKNLFDCTFGDLITRGNALFFHQGLDHGMHERADRAIAARDARGAARFDA